MYLRYVIPLTSFTLLQVRDEIGSDTPVEDEFGVASGIGINGFIYEMVYTSSGRDFGTDPLVNLRVFVLWLVN